MRDNSVCRSIQLSHFFKEKGAVNCDQCDVCIAKKKSVTKNFQQRITDLIKERKEISKDEIATYFDTDEETTMKQLRYLLSKDFIGIKDNNNFFIL